MASLLLVGGTAAAQSFPGNRSPEFEHPGKAEQCSFTNPDNLVDAAQPPEGAEDLWESECGEGAPTTSDNPAQPDEGEASNPGGEEMPSAGSGA